MGKVKSAERGQKGERGLMDLMTKKTLYLFNALKSAAKHFWFCNHLLWGGKKRRFSLSFGVLAERQGFKEAFLQNPKVF